MRLSQMLLLLVVAAAAQAARASPDSKLPIRAAHVVTLTTTQSEMKRVIDIIDQHEFNTLIIQFREGSSPEKAPWTPADIALTMPEITELVGVAKQRGITVVPELKLLTHQEKFFQGHYPELMYNSVTYDPRKQGVYEIVFPLIDELIDALDPTAFHIGHDEVVGWNARHAEKLLKPGERMLPAELFLEHVLRIRSYLAGRNIETWMWGDMLISPEEFPNMLARHLHGSAPGYGKALRDKLPKDIVICDWHYYDSQRDFASLARLRSEGYQVLGATFAKEETIANFSRYAARAGARGMIATTWYLLPRNQWIEVERVFRAAGTAFAADFPDGN